MSYCSPVYEDRISTKWPLVRLLSFSYSTKTKKPARQAHRHSRRKDRRGHSDKWSNMIFTLKILVVRPASCLNTHRRTYHEQRICGCYMLDVDLCISHFVESETLSPLSPLSYVMLEAISDSRMGLKLWNDHEALCLAFSFILVQVTTGFDAVSLCLRK